jgi:histidinol-phosphate aminotransferase
MTVLPRPSILTIEPYVGGESKIPGINRIIKLSSNEGAFGPPLSGWQREGLAGSDRRQIRAGPGAHRLRQRL